MKNRIFLLSVFSFLLSISFSGCTTMNQSSGQSKLLQQRVVELERELARKDQELANLRYDSGNYEVGTSNFQEIVFDEKLLKEFEESDPVKITKSSKQECSSSDKYVKKTSYNIQRALKYAGCYSGRIDGKIGKYTKRAIRNFQRQKGLKVDGIVGKRTWSALKCYL